MVTQEEMRAKLSLDVSDVGKGQRAIEGFAESGHKSFVHVGSSARSFHKLLHKITEESPLLGTALTAALNPISAAFIAAGIALNFFNQKLDEWNERMDEAEKRNSEAIFGAEAIRNANEAINKMAADHRKFMEMREDESKRVMDALDLENQKLRDNLELEEARLKLNKQMAEEIIKRQVNTGAMSLKAGMAALQQLGVGTDAAERKAKTKELSARRKNLEETAGNMVEASFDASEDLGALESEKEKTAKRVANMSGLAEKQKKDYEAAQKEAERARKNTLGSEGMLGGFATSGVHLIGKLTGKDLRSVQENYATEAEAKAAEEKRRLEDYNKKLEEMKKHQDEINASYDETKDKVSKWESSLQNVNKQIAKTKEEQDKLKNMPNTPGAPMTLGSPIEFGTSELARYNTYYGAIARRIMLGQQIARNAAAAGNDDFARSVLSEVTPGGNSPYNLYKLLPQGLTREQNEAQRQKTFIDTMLQELNRTGDGVPVKVTGLPNAE